MKNALVLSVILKYMDKYEDERGGEFLKFYDEYANGYNFEDKTNHNFVRDKKYYLDVIFEKDDLSSVQTSYFATIHGVSEL